ncbi:beta-N-acetylhexosaminidase [Cupriavidus gilardii]|uniref:beta-N-acetylhexosaminidase n=1 Tax=Cupriavidus TaxID=106589 RepID=UPI0011F097D8|nr:MULTISPECIES: beta-N-acetylhexosaminidase [Cupriavidus]KAA0182494.1 beta-N-acetylhexosaminidase [Cupriavidus gilardii]MBO4121135.1 beta-N-acetylhexosaminidase [Cupriavidus gilardii]MCA7084493.1 beta-N-acetylhexosaminidase [Cupriavidus sp. DB3]UZN48825.1 beta-N-acetylhexosaminidase [Cupriavidus cauae]
MTKKNAGKRPGPVVLDVKGKQLDADDARRISHPLTGGVILFARNFESRAQLVSLTREIRALRDDVLICIDHEGGRVQRCKTDGFTHLPAMAKLGELWDRDVLAATRAAVACGYVLAAELRACDIDLSFTPVLDLDYGRSGVIGDRAFHADPRVVAMLANHLTHGLLLAGMANCGKHFPGHGHVEADSHVAVPVDERTLDEILEQDVRPYQWMGMTLASVMPAHVIYPKVDPNPAGFSRYWLQDILRGQLGFEGVIFSDDLSMEGASVAGTVTQGARAALDAGCDMVLICNHPERADQLLAELDVSIDKASQRRVRRLFARGKAMDWNKLEQDAGYRSALRQLRDEALIG